MKFDVLIVGAGFAGLTMAERLSSIGRSCTIIDKRPHIGGNAYDCYDEAGVLIHPYGPHLFHTNSDAVFDYLSRFTKWIPATYTSSSYAHGRLWSFPINLKTFEQLQDRECTTEDMESYLASKRVKIDHPANSEEAIVSQVGWELYEMFYKGYVLKQWDRHPRDLAASVCQRIPIRTTRNDLYFNDRHQCMPAEGYTRMLWRMLPTNADLILGVDYDRSMSYNHLVYTGPIDQFFDYAHGPLPYRSLVFDRQSFKSEDGSNLLFQPTVSVNYPNDCDFTRIVEAKHITGQVSPWTTIVREYPSAIGEPYYPIPAPDSAVIYEKYRATAESLPDVTFVGRLARYRYMNMDQTVAMARAEFDKLRKRI